MTMTTTVLVDAEDRRCIREDLDRTLVVEAAAGTGKTTELVARMVNTLAEGVATVDQMVAVTFTEKAAGELKLRLRERLERERPAADGVRRHRLEEALAHLEEAQVSTIHGFCADLLRERPVEADVDPRFEVLLEPASARLLESVVDDWLQGTLEAPPPGVRRVLRRAFRDDDAGESGPIGALRRAVRSLAEWRDFDAAWRRDPVDRLALVNEAIERIAAVAAMTQGGGRTDRLRVTTAPLRRFARVHGTPIPRGASGDDLLDGCEALLGPLLKGPAFTKFQKGYGTSYAPGVTREQVKVAHAALRDRLQAIMDALEADLAATLHEELQPCLARYEAAKVARGALDFTDLLIRARDLLRDHRDVRVDFQRRYRRLFVDEFQDTDPIQAEILLLLAADDPDQRDWTRVCPLPGKLFIVGDPKQAIYRFRRADVETYWQVRRHLEGVGARTCTLRTCFRSVPTLQRAINHVFAPLMNGDRDAAQAEYVPLEPVRRDADRQPALVALPVPEPYGVKYVNTAAIEASLPDAVGAFVSYLVHESGWTVSERGPDGGEVRVPLRPRHVAILFRRFTSWTDDVTRPYVEALEARQVPHLLVGGRSFHEREEVDALRVALSAIEWPDDELSVYAVLRGAFFAFADDQLLAYRSAHGGRLAPLTVEDEPAPPGRPVDEEDEQEAIADALRLLRTLHRRRNRVPVQDTVQELLRATRAHAGLALRPGGEQALANVLHVVELARQYEAGGGESFRGFVQRFLDETQMEAAESPVLEEGTDGVRLMTVHKAKGLEFPVVVLADITCRLSSDRPSRAVVASRRLCVQTIAQCSPIELMELRAGELARDKAEGERLAYVAATRARDLLVIPAVGDEPYPNARQGEKWLGMLNAALYPPRPWPAPADPMGCPPFGRDSVKVRPDGEAGFASPVRPGRYTLGSADAPFDVTWWCPYALHLGAELAFGERQKALIARQAPEARVREGHDAVDHWTQLHANRIARGSAPSLDVQRITTAAAARQDAAVDVDVQRVGVTGRRPAGREFGALVHEVLAATPLDAVEADVAAVAAFKGRILAASPTLVEAATAVVVQTLQHGSLRAAAAADRQGRCLREAPVTLRLDDGTLVEGLLDLAFEDADGWTVVDFKTDREIDDRLETYRRQVAIYARALAAATGRPARGVLLRV